MTPKSLLRHPAAASSFDELASGTFAPVLESEMIEVGQVKRVILCTGKVYYELADYAEKTERSDVALVRVEQLYPFPEAELKTVLERYPAATEVFWCQEEARNQGAWTYMASRFADVSPSPLRYVGSPEAASTAPGYPSVHAA